LAVSVARSSEILRRRGANWRWGGMALTAVALGGVIAAFVMQGGSTRHHSRASGANAGTAPSQPDRPIDQLPTPAGGPSEPSSPTPQAANPTDHTTTEGRDKVRGSPRPDTASPDRGAIASPPDTTRRASPHPHRRAKKGAKAGTVDYLDGSPL